MTSPCSPHTSAQADTGDIMKLVIWASLPGLIAQSYFFGPGNFINVLLACLTAVLCEAAVLTLRRRPLAFYLRDYSAVVSGLLLGLSLPPYCPWWIVIVGAAVAIVMAKQLYGGMGFNPFNPAMVAYVVLLISFPVEMTQWPTPRPLLAEDQSLIGPLNALLTKIGLYTPPDGYTAATPLDVLKQNNGQMVEDLYAQTPLFATARWAGAGWEWVNIGFLLGGLFLLYRRVFSWHAPFSMLLVLSVMASLFYDSGSSNSGGSALFHLLSGATMLGAFFIVTDPVSSAVSRRGRLIYGGFIGFWVYVIRTWGNYPDALAFAVLLMNFAAPFIDYYTLPRTYGHSRPRRATAKEP